ncbi:MFS transporter [Paenibacillus albiflavus]|uniref:MFS transporter n=1 Tax=Paenibacillus albiflavus TaxID=2545760 RepID=A0A4R4E291_9BACL|nr:MFS transporter [Paenibacillus albiflavus]TCZ72873.1 MFS transporter [Paenibacillus albiflavus]
MQLSKADNIQSTKLDGQTWLLLVVNGLFIVANAISGTFLGVYIWKTSNNFLLLGWYTLLSHCLMALTFWTAGKWVKEGNKMMCLRLGILISAVFYTIVLVLNTNSVHYIWLLGIIQGIAAGCFWLAFNVIYFEMTNVANRDRFNGLSGIIGAAAGIIVPWCSGLIISKMTGNQGYRIIFILSLCTFIASVIVSLFLHNRKTEGTYEWTMLSQVLGEADTPWRSVFAALAAQGMRESVFGIMIALLVYIQTGSELRLGNFTMITSLVTFISFYIVGKWLKPKWRRGGMLLGTIGLSLAILALFIGYSYKVLLVFGIGTALFMPLFTIPMTSSVFDLIGSTDASVRNRVEFVVIRELGLNAGRILSILLFLLTFSINQSPLVINCFLLIIGSFPIISWLFMQRQLKSTF